MRKRKHPHRTKHFRNSPVGIRHACPWLPFVGPNGQTVRYTKDGMIDRYTRKVIKHWDVVGISLT